MIAINYAVKASKQASKQASKAELCNFLEIEYKQYKDKSHF